MSAPDWLKPGAPAVILQPWNSSTLACKDVTIDRVLKRDVVTSDGARFRIDTLMKQVGGAWGHSVYLVSPDDPRVAETRTAIRASRLRSAAANAYQQWRRREVSAREVAGAFAALAKFEATQ